MPASDVDRWLCFRQITPTKALESQLSSWLTLMVSILLAHTNKTCTKALPLLPQQNLATSNATNKWVRSAPLSIDICLPASRLWCTIGLREESWRSRVIMQDEPPEAGDRAGKSLRRDERWDNRRVSYLFFLIAFRSRWDAYFVLHFWDHA